MNPRLTLLGGSPQLVSGLVHPSYKRTKPTCHDEKAGVN